MLSYSASDHNERRANLATFAHRRKAALLLVSDIDASLQEASFDS